MTLTEFESIFIHFPRTGGSSIENYFGWSDGYKETTWDRKGLGKKIIRENHHTSSDEYIRLNGEDIWHEFFTFTFVRNPWDWFVSNFNWDVHKYLESKKAGRPQKYRRIFIAEECGSDFNTFIRKGYAKRDWFKFNMQKDFTKNVDFVGKFENLQTDFDHICKKTGADTGTLPHLKNLSDRPHFTEYYEDDTKEIIGKIFLPDIEYFRYEFRGQE